jgi:hemoglobin
MFERYGGFAVVHQIAAAFYDKVMEQPALGAYFAKVNVEQLILHQTRFFASLMGGPPSFTDEALRRAHAPHNIARADFLAIVAVARETLREFGMDAADIDFIVQELAAREAVIVRSDT